MASGVQKKKNFISLQGRFSIQGKCLERIIETMINRTVYDGFTSEKGQFNSGAFVEAFLIYDTILISNPAIIPRVAESIGVDSLEQLLLEGRVSVECGGPTGQAACDYRNPGFFTDRPLNRPLRFSFETIYVDPNIKSNLSIEDRLARTLRDARGNKITQADLDRLYAAALRHKRIIDGSMLRTSDDFRRDLESKPGFVVGLIMESLARDCQIPVHALNTSISIEEVSDDVFQINTNLDRLLGVSVDQLHDWFKKPFFEITGTNLQLHRMRAVEAIAGLNPIQARITSRRLDFLSKVHSQGDLRNELTRIIEIIGVPTLPAGSKININSLILLSESDEARVFRDWLYNSSKLSDQEIKEAVSNWKKRLGELLVTKNSKGLRWLTSTGIGILEPVTGAVTSVLDFFLDRFLPNMGPIGFIVGDYQKFIREQVRK